MTHSLWFLVGIVAFSLAVDWLFYVRVLPGGTITTGLFRLNQDWPIVSWVLYPALCFYGFRHFFWPYTANQ